MSSNTVLGLAILGVGGYLLYRWMNTQSTPLSTTVPAAPVVASNLLTTDLSNPAAARASAFDLSVTPTAIPTVAGWFR